MKSGPILLFGFWGTAVGGLLTWASICTAEKTSDSTPLTLPMDCRPYHLRAVKFLLKNFNKCSRELKANTTTDKEYEENIGCAMKCTMRNTGYAGDDGKVTVESIRKSILGLVPAVIAEPIVSTLIVQCHDKYGSKLNPQEALCKAYSEYAFCIQNTIADLIESEYCIKYEKKN